MLGDIKSKRLIHIKGWLFLVVGVSATAVIIFETQSLKTTFLLAMAVWGFCRFYYYLFYVIEKYTDPGFRYSGLWSFIKHRAMRKSA